MLLKVFETRAFHLLIAAQHLCYSINNLAGNSVSDRARLSKVAASLLNPTVIQSLLRRKTLFKIFDETTLD